jgi:hypothetical protein
LTERAAAPPAIHETAPIKEISAFYLAFLSALVNRQEDVRGMDLRQEVRKALDSASSSLSECDKWLLPAGDWQQPELFLSSIDDRMAPGEFMTPGPERVREIYVRVLKELLTRLEGQIDDSLVRLLFRLAARDALREGGHIALKYSLLEGIPEAYLRQSCV